MRWRELFVGGLLSLGATVRAQQPTAPDSHAVYAIVGARIEVGDGRVIAKGVVVLRDGLIAAVGTDVPVPPDAEIIKGDGLTVYPGFVDAYSTTGLKLPDWQPNQDVPPDRGAEAPPSMREANRKGIRPELRAVDCLALADSALAPIRKQGFTTALLAPSGGTINGVDALVNLSGQPKRDCVVAPTVAMGFTFQTAGGGGFFGGGGGGYPGTLLGVQALTRQTLLDARRFRTLQAAFEQDGGLRAPDDDGLAALLPVLDGKLPALYDADREVEIKRALHIAEEFHLRLMLNGGLDAWKIASTLAQRQIPVLLSVDFGDEPGASKTPDAKPKPPATTPTTTTAPGTTPGEKSPADTAKPESKDDDPDADVPKAVIEDRHRKWEEKVVNAGQLNKAGVLFAFTSKGTRDLGTFWKNVRRAIKAGLPRDAALRALTVNPAKIFGIERQMGTVETGKIAALVVMTGDFADEKSKVRYLFIDRNKFDTDEGK